MGDTTLSFGPNLGTNTPFGNASVAIQGANTFANDGSVVIKPSADASFAPFGGGDTNLGTTGVKFEAQITLSSGGTLSYDGFEPTESASVGPKILGFGITHDPNSDLNNFTISTPVVSIEQAWMPWEIDGYGSAMYSVSPSGQLILIEANGQTFFLR